MKLKEFIKKFITQKPEIFCILSLAYFLAGSLAIFDPYLRQINPNLSLHPTTAFVWFFGLFCFLLGIKYSKLLFKINELPIFLIVILGSITLYSALSFDWISAFIISLLAAISCLVFSNVKKYFSHFTKYFIHEFIIGACIFILNLFLTGIPLLNPELHYNMVYFLNSLFFLGFYIMLISIIRLYQFKVKICRILFLFLIFLTTLSTFRTYVAIVVLTWLFLESKIPRWNKKTIFLLSIVVVCALVSFIYIDYFLKTAKYPWKLSPLRTTEYRLASTLHVFDDLVKKSFPFGYSFGKALLTMPGKFVCSLYNCNVSGLTSTAMGEIMLDFGLIGVFIVMFYMGSILQKLYKTDYALYCLLISHAIVAIEIGFNIFLILVFTYLSYLRLEKWNSKKLD